MGSELVLRQKGTVATSGDNGYKAVQDKMSRLAGKMEDAGATLETLRRGIRANANKAARMTTDITHAELDRRYIEVMELLVDALVSAAGQARALEESALHVADLAQQTRAAHRRLYGGLDYVRTNRNVSTPKPGFFND
ncbi:conjugal transfer protein TraB [Streptomyces goshikiensis]|uniref:conjugal transfer protein TraB n=1 Tax=Streptomyces goshikiensis TaxID=1942 RepID=UPI00331C9DA7